MRATFEQEPKALALVFVHGLFSDASAWDEMAAHVAEDDQLGSVRTYRFVYATPMKRFRPDRAIPTLDLVADRLNTFLRHTVHESEVALVTHSQGGLVALRLIDRHHLDGFARDDAPAIRLVAMYACPHGGSQFGWRTRKMFLPQHPQEMSLQPLNESTAESIRRVIIAAGRGTIPGDPRFVALIGESDGIVTPASARGVWAEVETVSGDHSTVIRPNSPETDNYRVLRKWLLDAMVRNVPMGPVGMSHGAPRFWTNLAAEVVRRARLNEWDWAVGGLVRTSYGVHESVLRDLFGFVAWVQGRIFPPGHDAVRTSLENLSVVVSDLLRTFNLHTDMVNPEAEDSFIRVHRWHDSGGFNPNYDRDATAYDTHVNLLLDLTLEATRAAQWFCDVVREEIDPNFRMEEGALQLEAGPFSDGNTRILRPEYSTEQRSSTPLPYPGLEQFKIVRYQRDHCSAEPERADSSLSSELDELRDGRRTLPPNGSPAEQGAVALKRFGPSEWSTFGNWNAPEIVFRGVFATPAPVEMVPAADSAAETAVAVEERETLITRALEDSMLTYALRHEFKNAWHWLGDGKWEVLGGSGGPNYHQLLFVVDWAKEVVRQPFVCRCSVITGPRSRGIPGERAIVVALDFGISLIELEESRTPAQMAYRTTPPPAPAAMSIGEVVAALDTLVEGSAEIARELAPVLLPSAPIQSKYIGAWIQLNGPEIQRVMDLRQLKRLSNPTAVSRAHLGRFVDSGDTDESVSQQLGSELLMDMLSQSDFREYRSLFPKGNED